MPGGRRLRGLADRRGIGRRTAVRRPLSRGDLVGVNPHFDDVEVRQVEAYVLDETDLDLYGHRVEVQFVRRIRGMVGLRRASTRSWSRSPTTCAGCGPRSAEVAGIDPRHRRAPTIDPWTPSTLLLAVVAAAPADSVNLWGALGCAVAYSAALLATLDAFADLILARDDSPAGRLTPAVGLKFGSKLAAAAIAVISAAIVLALDANWFAFTALTIAFVVVVAIGVVVMLRHRRARSDSDSRVGG